MRLHHPLDDIFATGSYVRVLRALFDLPQGAIASGRELARRAGVSNPTAQSTLSALADQGLLSIRRVPRSVFYQLNRAHALFPQLQDLFLREDALPEMLESDLGRTLPQLADVRSAYIFGSAARREMRPESDIDVAVFLDPSAALPEAPEEIEALEKRYGSRINVMALHPRRSQRLLPTIEREGIPIRLTRKGRVGARRR